MMDVGSIAAGTAPAKREVAQRTARDFEAVFAGAIAKLMVESIEVNDGFGGGHGEEMFRGVMAEQLGAEMGKRGTLGIAPAVLDQILRLQGEKP